MLQTYIPLYVRKSSSPYVNLPMSTCDSPCSHIVVNIHKQIYSQIGPALQSLQEGKQCTSLATQKSHRIMWNVLP